MISAKVTLTRDNDTSDGSAEQSHLIVTVRTTGIESAESAARAFWADQGDPSVDEFHLGDIEEV